MHSFSNGAGTTTNPVLHNLLQANKQCLALSTEFVHSLEPLAENTQGSSLRSVKKTWKSVWNRENSVEMERKVFHARENLIIAFLIFLNSQSGIEHDKSRNSIAATEGKILDEMKKNTSDMQVDLRRIEKDLSDLTFEGNDTASALNQFQASHQAALHNISQILTFIFASQNKDLRDVMENLNDVLTHLNKPKAASLETAATGAAQKLVDSIAFAAMNERRSQITEAHSTTFKWILDYKRSGSWDDFLGWLGQVDGKPVYWVRRKPGSGKSTLMRFLERQLAQKPLFGAWNIGYDIIRASYHFWYAGNEKQRSLRGLLCCLLYQLWTARPDLVARTVSRYRWQSAMSGSTAQEWTVAELQETLSQVVQVCCQDSRLLFVIDGLDECDGSDDHRQAMIDFFQSLTAGDGVKICLSSRPWTIFQDAFESYPRLRLEDLTANDIRTFVNGTLLGDRNFQCLRKKNSQLVREIEDEVLLRAQGVFLWVRLVLRDLLKITRDGGYRPSS
jgi:hypothetical protein